MGIDQGTAALLQPQHKRLQQGRTYVLRLGRHAKNKLPYSLGQTPAQIFFCSVGVMQPLRAEEAAEADLDPAAQQRRQHSANLRDVIHAHNGHVPLGTIIYDADGNFCNTCIAQMYIERRFFSLVNDAFSQQQAVRMQPDLGKSTLLQLLC